MLTLTITLVNARQTFCRTKLVTRNSPWNLIPRLKCWTTWGPKWKFIGAWSRGSNAHRPAWTHARSGVQWITNIVFRMRVLFHFHAGFTGRRDYQSRGRAYSFLNLRSRSLRSPAAASMSSKIRPRWNCDIAVWSYRGGKIIRPVA